MLNDKFSVLMSVYNAEEPEHLRECIDSIFNNSKIPNEVVIVEDGPLTDGLYRILDKSEETYKGIIKRIVLKENLGLGQALAIGLHECANNLVARMDADDICNHNRFELEISEFIKDDELVMVGTYIDEFYDNSNDIRFTRKVPLSNDQIIKFAKKRNPFNHVTVMFKKDRILQVGNYRKVLDVGYEDYDLWIRLLNAGFKVKNLDVSTVRVRTGEEMLKRRGNRKRLKTALYFRKQLRNSGFINNLEWIGYSFSTIVFTLSPAFIKGLLYKKILRK